MAARLEAACYRRPARPVVPSPVKKTERRQGYARASFTVRAFDALSPATTSPPRNAGAGPGGLTVRVSPGGRPSAMDGARRTPPSRGDLLEHRVDAREARLRALLYAVLHGGVALLGRLEAHRLGQLRLLAQILELEGLEVVLERLNEARGRIDLAELAL